MRKLSGFLLIASIVVFLATNSSYVSSYLTSLKGKETISVLGVAYINDALYRKVNEQSQGRVYPPINARIDPIWKAIPGYNGRVVDVEATYKKTIVKKRINSIQWVYKEVKPKRMLEDLGALPIYRGNEQKKSAALMVNVAWGTEYIYSMLKTLKVEKVKATFFFDGSWLIDNPNVAKKIFSEGHEIGNHAYSHPLMARITNERIRNEIEKTEDLIFRTLGVHSKYFAPPAGSFDQRVVDIARGINMKTILWTLDTVDWRKSSTPEVMIRKIEKKLNPGSLILMHPTDRTAQALSGIIQIAKKKKIHLSTISNVLSTKRID